MRALAYCGPFAWQSNKAILFCFTQNSVSEIEFGVRVQRLAFGINPSGRDAEFGMGGKEGREGGSFNHPNERSWEAWHKVLALKMERQRMHLSDDKRNRSWRDFEHE